MAELPRNQDWHLWSLEEQLAWIERLSADDLRDWLRAFVWTQATEPIAAPPTATPLTHLTSLLQRGSPALFVRVRTAIPTLLQEWSRHDPGECLKDLLFLCSTLRGAAAEGTIALIATARLAGRPDEVELRQECIGTLSGLGCTERTEHLFRRYITDINYSAYCYRALYRFDLSNAVTQLPTLVSAHDAAGVTQQRLRTVLYMLLFDHLGHEQRPLFWRDVLKLTRPRELEMILKALQSVRIVLAVPFKTSEVHEVEVIYNYSAGEQPHGSDKIDTSDISIETVLVINHTLERYLRASKSLGTEIMVSAAN